MGFLFHDSHGYHFVNEALPNDWHRGPKFEPSNPSRLINVIPEVLQRVQAIEAHLADGAKTPFVQASSRFSGGLHDPSEIMNSLHARLEVVEKALVAKAGK